MSDRHNRTKTASVGKTASAGTIKYFDYSLLFIIIFLVGFRAGDAVQCQCI